MPLRPHQNPRHIYSLDTENLAAAVTKNLLREASGGADTAELYVPSSMYVPVRDLFDLLAFKVLESESNSGANCNEAYFLVTWA